jgi:hypothetical protein
VNTVSDRKIDGQPSTIERTGRGIKAALGTGRYGEMTISLAITDRTVVAQLARETSEITGIIGDMMDYTAFVDIMVGLFNQAEGASIDIAQAIEEHFSGHLTVRDYQLNTMYDNMKRLLRWFELNVSDLELIRVFRD